MRARKESTGEAIALSIDEAARCIGVGRTTIYELIKSKEIRAAHVGRRAIIPKSELQSFLERRMEAAAA